MVCANQKRTADSNARSVSLLQLVIRRQMTTTRINTISATANVCGKAYNTPSTLAQHVYSLREELPFPCSDCELKFAFEGQLKQHHFKHCTLSAFPCSKCDKTYKREGEPIKHLKVHDNKTYSCMECKYSTKDPRNLKQHAKLHMESFPYMCNSCNKFFRFWMQKK